MTRHTFGPAPRKSTALIASNPVYQAFARKPMAGDLRTTQAIDARLAYDAVTKGTATVDDFETLGALANLITMLAEKHCTADDQATAQATQKAILAAQARFLDGKAWNFDYEGRKAMVAGLGMFEQMAEHIGQGAVTLALVEIIKRERRGLVHRMERTKQ